MIELTHQPPRHGVKMNYPWNRQKIRTPKNGVSAECNFSQLSKPLPPPPTGMMWYQDATNKEWTLISMVTATAEALNLDNAAIVDENPATAATSGGDIVAAVPVAVQSATPLQNKNTSTSRGVLYHEVTETDTFQGLCLRYKVTPVELRRANKMMGTNLKLAPSKLVIPANDSNQKLKNVLEPTKEEKIVSLVKAVSRVAKLSYTEARAYLELADWDLGCAIGNVKDGF
mmetsp:Transcript_17917/g.25389  ORF Transcript_17917/g.25389 Transcript_17917/m.25389 type:complete len:229 (-) Transcript_17917:114-800(-)